MYFIPAVHCDFGDASISCFTNQSRMLNFYVDGRSLPITKAVDYFETLGYVISKYILPTTNWTVGSHLFEASFNSAAFSSCGSGFRPPTYSAVIFKEGTFNIHIRIYK